MWDDPYARVRECWLLMHEKKWIMSYNIYTAKDLHQPTLFRLVILQIPSNACLSWRATKIGQLFCWDRRNWGPCQSLCDTIKLPSCSNGVDSEHRPKICSPTYTSICDVSMWLTYSRVKFKQCKLNQYFSHGISSMQKRHLIFKETHFEQYRYS